jgi:hypothetical protein
MFPLRRRTTTAKGSTMTESEHIPRDSKVTVMITQENLAWLWSERRRQERSIAYLVNKAVSDMRRKRERRLPEQKTRTPNAA